MSSTSKSVHLVKMYHVPTPPAEHPEIYEVRSDLEDDGDEWCVSTVTDTSTLWFRINAEKIANLVICVG